MPTPDSNQAQTKFARQKRIVTVVGVLLILAGIVILAVLKKVPPPLRIMAGLTDIFVGIVLLVLVRQTGKT